MTGAVDLAVGAPKENVDDGAAAAVVTGAAVVTAAPKLNEEDPVLGFPPNENVDDAVEEVVVAAVEIAGENEKVDEVVAAGAVVVALPKPPKPPSKGFAAELPNEKLKLEGAAVVVTAVSALVAGVDVTDPNVKVELAVVVVATVEDEVELAPNEKLGADVVLVAAVEPNEKLRPAPEGAVVVAGGL